jgi:light-regulated signal transduction histidine kinase (bacteriophytochrome)
MKPFLLESKDNEALRTLGRASVQIVHDLKNQLNGLKLYATFLRKRSEKHERPADELETIGKLMNGLDRLAADLSLIVEYGQPVELKRRPATDLRKILSEVAARLDDRTTANGSLSGSVVITGEDAPLVGEFDPVLLAQALESISLGAIKFGDNAGAMQIQLTGENRSTEENQATGENQSGGEAKADARMAVVEWPVSAALNHDPFRSFAGSDELRLSLAARIVEAHGGSAERDGGALRVRLPLAE